MKISESCRIGKRGTLVIPAGLRRAYGLNEGADVIVEEAGEGILIRPAMTVPLEHYTPRRRAEFLLTNTVDREDYDRAVSLVREMGIDPDTVPHVGPDEST